jgi:glycosyltransferase involved in cell wall biosynthesis
LIDIVTVRTNSVLSDPRLVKIVASLTKKYSLLALGWNRDGIKNHEDQTNSAIKDQSNHINLNVFNLRAPFGKASLISYLPMMLYFPLFWTWVFVKLIIIRPRVVHACDLDTVLPCVIYKLLFRKKLVFDVFDRYGMTFISVKFRRLSSVVNFLEELISKNADVLITISQMSLNTFRRKPKFCGVILNCSQDRSTDRKVPAINSQKGNLVIVYTGAVRTGRFLENITAAIRDLKGVEFIIAGPIVDQQLFNKITAIPNVKYRGLLYPKEALSLEANADALIALYDLDVAWNSISISNKVFEAMMCGIPVVTNQATELIKEYECGIMIKSDDVYELKSAIVLLRDDLELRLRFGSNGRKAFLEKYNWAKMEEKLYEIYDNLIKGAKIAAR